MALNNMKSGFGQKPFKPNYEWPNYESVDTSEGDLNVKKE